MPHGGYHVSMTPTTQDIKGRRLVRLGLWVPAELRKQLRTVALDRETSMSGLLMPCLVEIASRPPLQRQPVTDEVPHGL